MVRHFVCFAVLASWLGIVSAADAAPASAAPAARSTGPLYEPKGPGETTNAFLVRAAKQVGARAAAEGRSPETDAAIHRLARAAGMRGVRGALLSGRIKGSGSNGSYVAFYGEGWKGNNLAGWNGRAPKQAKKDRPPLPPIEADPREDPVLEGQLREQLARDGAHDVLRHLDKFRSKIIFRNSGGTSYDRDSNTLFIQKKIGVHLEAQEGPLGTAVHAPAGYEWLESAVLGEVRQGRYTHTPDGLLGAWVDTPMRWLVASVDHELSHRQDHEDPRRRVPSWVFEGNVDYARSKRFVAARKNYEAARAAYGDATTDRAEARRELKKATRALTKARREDLDPLLTTGAEYEKKQFDSEVRGMSREAERLRQMEANGPVPELDNRSPLKFNRTVLDTYTKPYDVIVRAAKNARPQAD